MISKAAKTNNGTNKGENMKFLRKLGIGIIGLGVIAILASCSTAQLNVTQGVVESVCDAAKSCCDDGLIKSSYCKIAMAACAVDNATANTIQIIAKLKDNSTNTDNVLTGTISAINTYTTTMNALSTIKNGGN